MKKILYGVSLMLLFAAMLCFPQTVITGAGQGLLLWFQVLVPTLLPFMMISRLLVKTNLVSVLSRVLYPLVGKLFGTTPEGSYCIAVGFLCGYPMGAKTIGDLYGEGAFSREHAQYLLCFCNNVSPGFISGFVVRSCLGRDDLLPLVFLILYGVPLLFSFPLRLLGAENSFEKAPRLRAASLPKRGSSLSDIRFGDLNDMIENSLASIGMLGGYVILFRILTQFLLRLPLPVPGIKMLLAGILEITSGIPVIAANTPSFPASFVLILACTAFGGLSGIAQTGGIVKKYGFSMKTYTLCKALQAVMAGLLGWLLITGIS